MAAEGHAMDALQAMKERPEKLIRSLSVREAVLISTLASAGKAMILDEIRNEYLDRVLQNIFLNYHFILEFNAMEVFAGAPDARKQREEIALTMKDYEHDLGTTTPVTALTILYVAALPETKKRPLIIGGATVQKALEDMMTFYKNVIEKRTMKDARTSGGYYINDEFYTFWEKGMRQKEKAMVDEARLNVPSIEAIFYGLENGVMSQKLADVKEMKERFRRMFEAKKDQSYIRKEIRAINPGGSLSGSGYIIPSSLTLTDSDEVPLLKAMLTVQFEDTMSNEQADREKNRRTILMSEKERLALKHAMSPEGKAERLKKARETLMGEMRTRAKKVGFEKMMVEERSRIKKMFGDSEHGKELAMEALKQLEEMGEEIRKMEK